MLSDFLELNKLEKEQLIQLCETLYTLIKDLAMGQREVPVNANYPSQLIPNPTPSNLPNPNLPKCPSITYGLGPGRV
jgi:hypothetical protein